MLDLLAGVRVIEVSHWGPDAVGGHLGDLGAEVIKVEPPKGTWLRGERSHADTDGAAFGNIRMNRGKKSIGVDLKTSDGQAILHELVNHSQVLINGLRGDAAARFGFDYATVHEINSKLVYCTVNGWGTDGPYSQLPTHGFAFDAFAGFAPPEAEDGLPVMPHLSAYVGWLGGPLYAALAIVAALNYAVSHGIGRCVELSEVDATIMWNFSRIDAIENGKVALAPGRLPTGEPWARYQYYGTRDGHNLMFMPIEEKFWFNFCDRIGRMDLHELSVGKENDPEVNRILRRELTSVFLGRTRSEWTQWCVENDVPGVPAYTGADVLQDKHMKARDLQYDQSLTNGEVVRVLGSPIKVRGSTFGAGAPPEVGADTEHVLTSLLGHSPTDIARFRTSGAI